MQDAMYRPTTQQPITIITNNTTTTRPSQPVNTTPRRESTHIFTQMRRRPHCRNHHNVTVLLVLSLVVVVVPVARSGAFLFASSSSRITTTRIFRGFTKSAQHVTPPQSTIEADPVVVVAAISIAPILKNGQPDATDNTTFTSTVHITNNNYSNNHEIVHRGVKIENDLLATTADTNVAVVVVVDGETMWGSVALITGTTIGAGLLALPQVTYTSGFVPSTMAILTGDGIMTLAGLYLAELTIRMTHLASHSDTTTNTTTIKSSKSTSLGLLDLYHQGMMMQPHVTSSSSSSSSQFQIRLVQYGSTLAYFFLHYAMMVAYIAQGGSNIHLSLEHFPDAAVTGPVVFTGVMAVSILTIPKRIMSRINNVLVMGVFLSMASIVFTGVSTINADALLRIDLSYQDPRNVVSSLPIIFLAFVYHNIVPLVVKELQYNARSIQTAIVLGTTLPCLMFVTWNAIVLGNMDPAAVVTTGNHFDPVEVLMSRTNGASWLGFSISTFSILAVITSLIGFTYGLNEAWNDLFYMATTNNTSRTDPNIRTDSGHQSTIDATSSSSKNVVIYGLIFIPPLMIALYNPNIFVPALDYGGTFGVTILFLLLPTYILWNLRYNVSNTRTTTSTINEEAGTILVPGGKIPMIGLGLTGIGLMLDQIIEKFDLHFILSP